MTSSEAFVETMVSHGTNMVFGIVGSAFMDALDIFEPAGIRFLPVQHEQNAVHMADGYSRVTNTPGVCIAQNGPGITNFVTGVAAAYWAHSPVVVITPETGSLTNGLGGFQETNQVSNEGTRTRKVLFKCKVQGKRFLPQRKDLRLVTEPLACLELMYVCSERKLLLFDLKQYLIYFARQGDLLLDIEKFCEHKELMFG